MMLDDPATSILAWGVVAAVALLAALFDIRKRQIPNGLTASLFFTGLAWALQFHGWVGLGESCAAALLLALPYVLLFAFAGGGAGDAKLMAGAGAWLGLADGMLALGGVALFGILLAVVKAITMRQARSVAGNVGWIASSLAATVFTCGKVRGLAPVARERMTTIPYGIAIFCGILATGVVVIM
ncbi:MAG: prepilin peptidase [Planctomycetota bacterium]